MLHSINLSGNKCELCWARCFRPGQAHPSGEDSCGEPLCVSCHLAYLGAVTPRKLLLTLVWSSAASIPPQKEK